MANQTLNLTGRGAAALIAACSAAGRSNSTLPHLAGIATVCQAHGQGFSFLGGRGIIGENIRLYGDGSGETGGGGAVVVGFDNIGPFHGPAQQIFFRSVSIREVLGKESSQGGSLVV